MACQYMESLASFLARRMGFRATFGVIHRRHASQLSGAEREDLSTLVSCRFATLREGKEPEDK